MPPPITLTAGTVAWLARCERRVWLDLYGDRTLQVADSPVAARQATAGVVHEAAVMATMLEPAQPIAVSDWPALVTETQAQMRAGAAEIRQAGLEVAWGSGLRLCGRPDVLRRIPQPSRIGAWSYEPVEIKQHNTAQMRDMLQLDLYRWLLTQVQGTTPDGELWLGAHDGRPQTIVQRAEPLASVEQQLLQISSLRQVDEPAITFARHCAYCPWRDACDQVAHKRQDIALLAGLDRRAASALRGDNITLLDDIIALPAARLARYPYVGASRAVQLHAHAQALISHAPRRKEAPRTPLPVPALFFDIESHPDTQEPWAFGWLDASGNPGIVIVSAARLAIGDAQTMIAGVPIVFVRDSAAGWMHISTRASKTDGAILHWGSYEQTCLDRSRLAHVGAILRPRLVDLHTVVEGRYALPIARGAGQTAGSLKAVGAYLGHTWPEQADWLLAWKRYSEWQEQTEKSWAPAIDTHLVDALAYLRADLEALRHVWGWLNAQESALDLPTRMAL